MPLFYQHTINADTKLAVWHITESEDFFLKKVPLQTSVAHPHKRLQHFAARYLLEILQPGFPFHLIEIADSRKPLLSNEKFHFSVSHCGDYAAAIVSENKLVGIDVELITPRVERIKDKFLSQEEMDLLPVCDPRFLTLCWSAKEAIYKWHGKGQVDFKNNMILDQLFSDGEHGMIKAHFMNEERRDLEVSFRFFEELCLAWV